MAKSSRSVAPNAHAPATRLEQILDVLVLAPLLGGAAVAWLSAGTLRAGAMSVALIWGGAVLAYHAGVRRGLDVGSVGSGRRRLGPTLWLFALAAGSMAAADAVTSFVLLILGYLSLAVIARRDGAGHPHPLIAVAAAVSLGLATARLLLKV